MSMFNLKEVQEEAKGSGVNEAYIYPGIRNKVIISKWSHGKSQGGTPFISVHLVTKEGKEASVEPKEFQFYVSEKALTMSLQKIKHIVTKISTAEKFESKSPADLDEMVEHLNDLTKGESLRMKFIGEQYLNSNQKVKEVARIGLAPFAEAIQEGSDYPVIDDENTQLIFDKNNEYDFKKLPNVTPTPEGETVSNDLPW